jgi:hypothetical protein
LSGEKSSAESGSRRLSFGSRMAGRVVPSNIRIGEARSTVPGPKPSHLS